jgi:hypothetical protein
MAESIHIKMPPAAAKFEHPAERNTYNNLMGGTQVNYVSPSLTSQGVPVNPPIQTATILNKPPPGQMIMGEKGPIPAAPALTIAPGLLPLVIATPPAAPTPAPTAVARHPLGVGDVHDRLVALEVSMRSIWAKTEGLLQDV